LESEGWKMLFRGFSGSGMIGGGGGGLFGWVGSLFGIGRNANGTNNWRGGLTWVGERGPELLNLPRGSQIHDAQTSAAMMRGGAGGGVIELMLSGDLDARIVKGAENVVIRRQPAIVRESVRATYQAAREVPIR